MSLLHSPTDLSELLKEGTKESHDRAENTQFVKDFLKGRIKKELFKVCMFYLFFYLASLTACVTSPLAVESWKFYAKLET